MGKASNFNIGRIKIFWNFFRGGHRKMQKTGFFRFSANYLRFWYWNTYPGYHHVKPHVQTATRAPSELIRGVAKKRHGHNNEFWALKRIAGPPNHVRRPCYSFQDPKLNIVAVSFFGNARFYWNFFSKFDPTLSAYNYASKTPNLKNYHIFGILRTSAFTWYPPI